LDWSGRPSGGGSRCAWTTEREAARRLFPTLSAEAQGAETVLAGALADQAALYGVLAQIEALGLELIEVRRTHS
jgi:hypothetical protein